ncbi:glycoside hydrolase family 2 [Paenibacillus sp. CC-CFT747]|nr:glycoside hydrolase family 2 [Paenibacillus sp. CC-CFT747]
MTTQSYSKDYPRPQFVRDNWTSLNGEWDFRFDDDDLGEQANWPQGLQADRRIRVPFTYETEASGIGDPSFHPRVWYEKEIDLPAHVSEKRVLLNFQAVDYVAKVWINGCYVGMHKGGYAAFAFDITPYVTFGSSNRVTVKAEDSMDCAQPRGKQRWQKDSFECFYVQTTGIWQTVWLEYVEHTHVDSVKITPDFDQRSVSFEYHVPGAGQAGQELQLKTVISMKGKVVKTFSMDIDRAWMQMSVSLLHEANGPWKFIAWAPEHPNLFDVEFILYRQGVEIDRVLSYFGMRKISIENGKVLLNNAPIYQRLILDQGYWKDSHLTPPSEEAILEDIDWIFAMGYNGVRKHMKIEDQRFLYWCDVKGLLVWSEMAATFEFNDQAVESFTDEWIEIVRQNYNHPSIVTWVPFNESWGIPNVLRNKHQQQFTEAIYHLTKSIDPYRPVIVNDGWEHTVSDILTLHDYEEDGERFLLRFRDKEQVVGNRIAFNNLKYALAEGYGYRGQPIIISEYGGIAFQSDKGWGYGNQVGSEEAFLERFRSITEAIQAFDYISGYCYTQITDVQQEINGLLTEDRKPKVNLEAIRKINRSSR